MSYKYDVALVLQENDYIELKNKINDYDVDEFDLNLFKKATRTYYTNYMDCTFVILQWKYVRWDVATSEMVQLVEEYVDMLEKNKQPFRYIKVGEFITDVIDKKYNDNVDIEVMSLIESVHPKVEIKIGL